MMMIRRNPISVLLGLLVAIASLFSTLGPVASPAAAVGTGRHPLAEVMREDGQPLPVGTMRTIATDIAEGIIGSSPPVDFALLSRGRVVWATDEGTGSLLIFIDMSREQRQFSVLPLPFKIQKIVADEANQRVWFLHKAFDANRGQGQREDCLISMVPFDKFRVTGRHMDVQSMSLKGIKNPDLPGDPTNVLDLKISREGIAALTTNKGVVIFRGDINCLYIAETTPSMIPLRRPSAQSTGFDGLSRLWTCDEGPSDAQQSRSCTLLKVDQSGVGEALFSVSLPQGVSLLGPSVGLAIPEGSSVVASAGMVTAEMGDQGVTVFSPVVRQNQVHQPRLVASVPNASGAAPIIPSAIIGPDGALWYVDFANDCIYRHDVRTNSFTCYPLPARSRPSKILAGIDGKVYVLARGSRRIIAITAVEMIESEVREARVQSAAAGRGTGDQQGVAKATAGAGGGASAQQVDAQVVELRRQLEATKQAQAEKQAQAREAAEKRRADKAAKQRRSGELRAARLQALRDRAQAKKLRRQELANAANAVAQSHADQVGPDSASDDASAPESATDSDSDDQDTEAHSGAPPLQIDWDHIAQGHFVTARGGGVATAGGGAAARTAPTSTGANGWLASLPKSQFLEETSNRSALQPLIDQAILSRGNRNRVYSASGNLLVFSRATSPIGRCFDLVSRQWQDTSNYVVVLSPDSSSVITVYPIR